MSDLFMLVAGGDDNLPGGSEEVVDGGEADPVLPPVLALHHPPGTQADVLLGPARLALHPQPPQHAGPPALRLPLGLGDDGRPCPPPAARRTAAPAAGGRGHPKQPLVGGQGPRLAGPAPCFNFDR